jgi:redox-sensing transcriptional repressor
LLKSNFIRMNLPEKTVERLSQYRRVLLRELELGKTYVYSHELATLLHLTSVQVRRDIMLIGHTGTLRKGYKIQDLIDRIGVIIDCKSKQKVAIIGIGNLGQAILHYYSNQNTKLTMHAAFDTNPDKIGKEYFGITCYSVEEMTKVIKKQKISIAILTMPPEYALDTVQQLVKAGIRGIVNYTPVSLQVDGAYLEQYDMITSLEKVAYFAKPKFGELGFNAS